MLFDRGLARLRLIRKVGVVAAGAGHAFGADALLNAGDYVAADSAAIRGTELIVEYLALRSRVVRARRSTGAATGLVAIAEPTSHPLESAAVGECPALPEWKSEVASRKNPDGAISFITTVPSGWGFEFVMGSGSKRTLTIRDAQHEYVFEER